MIGNIIKLDNNHLMIVTSATVTKSKTVLRGSIIDTEGPSLSQGMAVHIVTGASDIYETVLSRTEAHLDGNSFETFRA